MSDLPPIPDPLRGLISARTWRQMNENNEDQRWACARGAQNRQTFYWRVINARTRWLEYHYPDRSRVWHITPFHPGGAYSGDDLHTWPPEHCTPTLLQREDERGRTHYRGACLACRWEGDEHTGTRRTVINVPIEEGHDHAWPGWRDLPYAPAAAVDEPHGPAWQHLDRLYPPGWLTAGAPLLRPRSSPHAQHQPPRHKRPGYLLNLPAPPRKAAAEEGTGTLFEPENVVK